MLWRIVALELHTLISSLHFSLPVDFPVDEILEDGEKNNRDETHDQEVSNLESIYNFYHL